MPRQVTWGIIYRNRATSVSLPITLLVGTKDHVEGVLPDIQRRQVGQKIIANLLDMANKRAVKVLGMSQNK